MSIWKITIADSYLTHLMTRLQFDPLTPVLSMSLNRGLLISSTLQLALSYIPVTARLVQAHCCFLKRQDSEELLYWLCLFSGGEGISAVQV